MLVWYFFPARNNGTRATGLEPTFTLWVQLGTRIPLPPPPITEIGNGLYQFPWDAHGNGDAIGQVDLCGTTPGVNPAAWSEGDRYVDITATRESDAILSTLGRTTIQ